MLLNSSLPGVAFVSPITLPALSNIRAHTLLLGATSVRDNAKWCINTIDAATKHALIGAPDRVVLLADSANFNFAAMMKVADL
jgi:DeoR/GlpR family transcriptional regulator of sugar metabolism